MRNILFKDFITLQRGFDLPRRNMVPGQYPVVGSTTIIGWHNDYKKTPPGVVTGRSGSLGTVQFLNQPYWPHNTSLWVKDFMGNHPKYVYYFLQKFPLAHFNSGAGVPTLNRNDLENYQIDVHLIDNQRKIATILSAYDDLIENNTRRIAILEEMAQRIYSEWFIHLRYPGHVNDRLVDSGTELGNIPDGWEILRLKNIVNFVNDTTFAGEHLSNLHYLPIDCLPRKSLHVKNVKHWTEAQSSLQLFESGDVLFGAMRPYFHKVIISPFNGVTRKTCFVLRGKEKKYQSFSLLTMFQDSTIAFANSHSKGSTIPYAVWNNSLENMLVLVPTSILLDRFEELVSPMIKRICNTFFQNRNLSITRDLLLPKLISGKIDVTDLDIDIG